MASLIITLVTIALVGALILAVTYFGGSAFTDSQQTAKASAVLNQSAQISGALTTYRAHHGGFPTGTQEQIKEKLVTSGYLAAVPESVSWTLVNDYALATDLPDDVCLDLNKKLGINEVPTCSSISGDSRNVCCSQ